MAMETSHIWLGSFRSENALEEYFEENYDEHDDEDPINKFAEDQGESFYDHDWVEYGFNDTDDLRSLIDNHSYSKDYIDEVIAAAVSRGIRRANVFVMSDIGEIQRPRTVESKEYQLWYMGRFYCKTE